MATSTFNQIVAGPKPLLKEQSAKTSGQQKDSSSLRCICKSATCASFVLTELSATMDSLV
jgi:hypothetical protein